MWSIFGILYVNSINWKYLREIATRSQLLFGCISPSNILINPRDCVAGNGRVQSREIREFSLDGATCALTALVVAAL